MVGVALGLQVPETAVYIVGSSLWCKDNVALCSKDTLNVTIEEHSMVTSYGHIHVYTIDVTFLKNTLEAVKPNQTCLTWTSMLLSLVL